MLKVLIVEDEDIIRKGLAYTIDWLSMDCVIVGEASNGLEGEEKILELKPDIVLADIMMPKQNGIEMIRKTKDKVKYKSIILTSYAEFDYAKQAIDLKVSEYLLKPVEEEQLRDTIEQIRAELGDSKEVEKRESTDGSILDMNDYIEMAKGQNIHVTKALEIIRDRYGEKLFVSEVAEELGVSASFLLRKFKTVTGQTFLDFVNRYRIHQAVRLLKTGEYKVYEVSDMTGFTDYKHFSSVFKKYTDVSPTEFTKHSDL